MKFLLISTFGLILAGTDAVATVTGYRGRSVLIKCLYESGYEEHKKYLCRGKCSYGRNKDIPVHSGSPAEDPRFSLHDDTRAKVFTVTISDLRPEDGGTYWCAVERTGFDIYTEIRLQVKTDAPAVSTVSQSAHTTHTTSTHVASPSVHADITHSSTAHPLNGVNRQTIAASSHDVPGVATYIMISTGAVLFTVGLILAIYCKINHQGSETVTQSCREVNENGQNLLPLQAREQENLNESDYECLVPITNQSDSVYQNVLLTNNQSYSVYQNVPLSNNQLELVYQSPTLTNNQSDSDYQSPTLTNNQSDSDYQSPTLTNNQSDSDYQSPASTNNQSDSDYQSLTLSNNQSDSDYQSPTLSNNQSDSDYQSPASTNNQSDSDYQSLTLSNNQSDSDYQSPALTNNQSD